MQMTDVVARGAEQHRGFRFVQPQHVDHGVLDVGRGNRHGLVNDIAVAAIGIDGRNPQRVLLIALGQGHDRARHGRGKQQGTAAIGRRVEQFLKILAKAHVEHFVGFIQHCDRQHAQIERAAFQMIAQPPRGADHDLRAVLERAAFAHRVHPADAGRHPHTAGLIEPGQFTADLQGQFARGRDHQGQGRPGGTGRAVCCQQLRGHGEAKGNRLT